MNSNTQYAPGPAFGAEVQKQGDEWTLVLIRDLRHPPSLVWEALTDPEQIREWAPYDADRNLATEGSAKLSTFGTPQPHVQDSEIKRAEKPTLLEMTWGKQDLRWELEATDGGTRLKLWHNINKGFIAMGAAGWHMCFDVLGRLLDGAPIGRMAGPANMANPGWQRLHAEYAQQFGVEMPSWAKQ